LSGDQRDFRWRIGRSKKKNTKRTWEWEKEREVYSGANKGKTLGKRIIEEVGEDRREVTGGLVRVTTEGGNEGRSLSQKNEGRVQSLLD